MGKRCLPTILALVGGVAGFGLRKWQLMTGFEPGTGLTLPGAPAAGALVAWTGLVALLVLALCWKNRSECAGTGPSPGPGATRSL